MNYTKGIMPLILALICSTATVDASKDQNIEADEIQKITIQETKKKQGITFSESKFIKTCLKHIGMIKMLKDHPNKDGKLPIFLHPIKQDTIAFNKRNLTLLKNDIIKLLAQHLKKTDEEIIALLKEKFKAFPKKIKNKMLTKLSWITDYLNIFVFLQALQYHFCENFEELFSLIIDEIPPGMKGDVLRRHYLENGLTKLKELIQNVEIPKKEKGVFIEAFKDLKFSYKNLVHYDILPQLDKEPTAEDIIENKELLENILSINPPVLKEQVEIIESWKDFENIVFDYVCKNVYEKNFHTWLTIIKKNQGLFDIALKALVEQAQNDTEKKLYKLIQDKFNDIKNYPTEILTKKDISKKNKKIKNLSKVVNKMLQEVRRHPENPLNKAKKRWADIIKKIMIPHARSVLRKIKNEIEQKNKKAKKSSRKKTTTKKRRQKRGI